VRVLAVDLAFGLGLVFDVMINGAPAAAAMAPAAAVLRMLRRDGCGLFMIAAPASEKV
jgi:hypothetical protein